MNKQFISRLLAAALCLLLLAGMFPSISAATEDIEGATAEILEGYAMDATEVQLTKYHLQVETLEKLFHRLYVTGQLPWYAEKYECLYQEDDGIVTSMKFLNLDFLVYNRNLYERAVAEILYETVREGMSDWEIALSIHDYLAVNFEYDLTETYFTGYDLLVGGTAVCAGYGLAYMDLMNRVGIPCYYVISETMEHGWNAVQIGGAWYFVDVTWDDPTSDVQGRVLHDHFLMSEEKAVELGYHSWEVLTECTDTSLDTGRMWQDMDSQITFDGAGNCFMRYAVDEDTDAIVRRDMATGEETLLVELQRDYITITDDGYEYRYQNRGLSYFNERLYYSNSTYVFSVAGDGNDAAVVYTHDHEATGTYISGSFVKEGTLYLTVSDHEGNMGVEVIGLGIEPAHTHNYTEEKVKSTCTEPGYTAHICECGLTYKTDPTLFFGHRYDNGTVIREATEDATGLKRYTCTACGEEKDEIIPVRSSSDDFSPVPIFIGIAVLVVILLLRKKKKKR